MATNTKIFRYAKWIAFSSFVFGTIIFLSYYQTSDSNILFVGYAYLLIAGLINTILLLWLLFVALREQQKRKQAFFNVAMLACNIPVVIVYCFMVISLLSTMRITFINPSDSTITQIRVNGCEPKTIEDLKPGASRQVHIHIPADCTIELEYNINGIHKKESVMGYCTVNMGQKLTHRIGERNDPVF